MDSPFFQTDDPEPAVMDERRRLENFARVSGGCFWQTDGEHRFIYMSESVREVTGIAPQWHYGKTRQDLGMPAAVTRAEWEAHLRALRAHEPFKAFVFQRPGPDGLRWMQTSGIPIFDKDGVFTGYQGIATDVTAQIEAENEAKLLNDAIEEFNEAFVLWDEEERLVVCNRRFREINEILPEFVTPGTTFRDHVTAVAAAGLAVFGDRTSQEWIENRIERFRNPGEPFEVLRHDGTWLWIVEQRMANGATVTTSTDITKLKRAEETTEAIRRRLHDAMEILPGAIVLFGRDDKISLTNSTYLEWFAPKGVTSVEGWTLEDLMRAKLKADGSHLSDEEIETWIRNRLNSHGKTGHEFNQQLADGRWVRSVDSISSEGGVARVLIDVTGLKRQQEELEEARKVAEEALKSAEEARKSAEEANQAKSEFLATISHEIRTPLNGTLGMAYLMRDSAMDAHQTVRLENIIASGNALQVIINDVLDMSKIEAGAVEIESAPFDMASVVASVSSLFGDVAADKGLRFEIGTLPETARHLVGDAARIRQVLWNLLSNAVKFTQQGGISVEFNWLDQKQGADKAESAADTLQIVVRDTGIGIAPDRLERIFDPFVQADASTTRRFGGTGLGLSIIRHLVELMGGEIRAESTPGKGSAFIVTVPLGAADSAELERYMAARKAAPNVQRPSLRILVAEDHPLNAMVTTELLQRQGHETVHVENGLQAVTAMNDGSFDLVLMDAHMPEMDGLEATRLIRAHPEHGRVLIIGLTAEAFVNQHKALREAGMNAIVTKPFTDNDLISAIWANLEPGEAPADAPSEAPGEDDWKAEGEAGFKAFAEARDPAMIRKLLELGRKTTADRLRELQAAVAAGDSEQIRFSAHTIKGACGTMFAIKLSGLALEIEQVHEDIAAVAEKMPAVEACVRETIDWWAELADRL